MFFNNNFSSSWTSACVKYKEQRQEKEMETYINKWFEVRMSGTTWPLTWPTCLTQTHTQSTLGWKEKLIKFIFYSKSVTVVYKNSSPKCQGSVPIDPPVNSYNSVLYSNTIGTMRQTWSYIFNTKIKHTYSILHIKYFSSICLNLIYAK